MGLLLHCDDPLVDEHYCGGGVRVPHSGTRRPMEAFEAERRIFPPPVPPPCHKAPHGR